MPTLVAAKTPALEAIMAELRTKGSEKTRTIYARHGMDVERVLGVSVADLKSIAKTIRGQQGGQQGLAMELYATRIMEAMYLAGMVAHGAKMTRGEIESWAEGAAGMQMISEYTVPWVAVEHAEGRGLALEWMKSKKEHVAAAGWCTYSGLVATVPDERLDLAEIEALMGKVVKEIDGAANRVRYTMNNFVIAVGTYVRPLLKQAKAAAKKLGDVSVDVGETACKVPVAAGYIEKVEGMGRVGVKKKTIRC
jgi:3-methyladenine DNA glycosylase AlkD